MFVLKSSVSIIIPVHNAASYLQACVDSCLKQTYAELELIIIENGSTDSSWSLLEDIHDERIIKIQIGKANASIARNRGLDLATGKYIMFLDADDILSLNKVELQVNELEKNQNSVASCAWAKFTDVINDAVVYEQAVWSERNPLQWLKKSWLGEGMMQTACWLIPRNIIDKAGRWDESLTLHDDGEFMCRVLLESKQQIFVDKTCVYYRQVEASLSKNSRTEIAAKSAFDVYKSYTRILKYTDSKDIRWALAHNFSRFLYEYSPLFPELLAEAKKEIKKLISGKAPIVGGSKFKRLANILGFYWALKLKGKLF